MADNPNLSGKQVRCIVVTPERALLDAQADFVALPLYDGELGVLPGRAPLIGRLGMGELRLRKGNHVERYFIDGGFAQVRDDVVTVLTAKAVKASEIDAEAARRSLQAALVAVEPEKQEAQLRAQVRARAQLRVAAHEASVAMAH